MRRRIYAVLVCAWFATRYERMIWVDETGFRTHMTRTRGWSRKGKRVRFISRRRSSPYTLVCAMGFEGVVCQWVFPKGMTEERWREFVAKKLIEQLGRGHIVLWDNLKIHQNEEALEEMRKAGHFVMFTPPYSPEGNPIEYMFSKLKTFVRKRCPRSAKQLREAIAEGLGTITRQDIASYFSTAQSYVLAWL
jgi:transposase